jgi:hypothetical protein
LGRAGIRKPEAFCRWWRSFANVKWSPDSKGRQATAAASPAEQRVDDLHDYRLRQKADYI